MSKNTAIHAATTLFASEFGSAATVVAFAPGRVNLLGEHTDYNGGVVLPVPLPMGTGVALSWGGKADMVQVRSANEPAAAHRRLDERPDASWSDYVLGAAAAALADQEGKRGLQIAISTTLPVGSGLSSSAALIVGILRGISELTGRNISPVEIAKMARRVENDFVGLPCGIMDQFAVSVGQADHALFLDTTTLEYDTIALPVSHRFVVVHSGSGHKLTDNGYGQRVAECAAARHALGVDSLSLLTMDDLDRINALDDPLAARARHIVTENRRVRDAVSALAGADVTGLASAMNASHLSQKDDYEVSTPQIDSLVETARAAGAIGARLTGGGFGGSIVALVKAADVETWCAKVQELCPKAKVLTVI